MKRARWAAAGLALALTLLSACGGNAPADGTPEPSQSPAASPTEPETPKPMKMTAALPEDAAASSEQPPNGEAYHSEGDAYSIFLTYEEAGEDTDTPGKFRETILKRLAEENKDDNYVEGDCVETIYQSYVAYEIGWITGSGEQEVRHQALFILTDSFIYRAQFDVASGEQEAYAAAEEQFFDSVAFQSQK